MKPHLAPLALVLALRLVGVYGGTAAKGSSGTLSLCELVGSWKDHSRHEVRVRAIFVSGAEQAWLYDPVCRKGEALAAVSFRQHTKGAMKKLDQLIAKDRRAWVVVEGVFHGPEPYRNVDPRLPAPIRERLEKSPRRYGHMDSFETMIEVTRVVEATEVAADVPRPGKPIESETGNEGKPGQTDRPRPRNEVR